MKKPYLIQALLLGALFLSFLYWIIQPEEKESPQTVETKILPKEEIPLRESAVEKKAPLSESLRQLKELVEKKTETVPTHEEQKRASDVLAFANTASLSMHANWFSQADVLAFFIRIYLGEWQLAILPKAKKSKTHSLGELTPSIDLFEEDIRHSLLKELDCMRDTLESMLNDYSELDKYVRDETTEDEGRRGKNLARSINASYARFCKARRTYFHVLNQEARKAEDIFLAENPLRRQIMTARAIFDLFYEVTSELSEENPQRSKTRHVKNEIVSLLDYAKEPPFRAAPLLERDYRAFLKDVDAALSALNAGNEEGFSFERREEFNGALEKCRERYNVFVRAYEENSLKN